MLENKDLLPEFVFADDDTVDTPTPPAPADKGEPITPKEGTNNDPIVTDDGGNGNEGTNNDVTDADSDTPIPEIMSAYEFYVENGIFAKRPDDKPFKGTLKDMEEEMFGAVDAGIDQAIEGMINPVPEFGKAAIALALKKGKDLTIEDMEKIIAEAKPMTMTIGDMDDEAKAYDYMVKKYQRDGHNAADATDMVNVLKDKGKLVENAKNFFGKDMKLRDDGIKRNVEDVKKQRQDKALKDQAFQASFADAIKTSGWRPDYADKVVDTFFSGKFKAIMDTALYKNPKALVQLIEFARHFDEKTGIFNMEAYKKEAFSPSVRAVANNMRKDFWSGSAGAKSKTTSGDEEYEFT